MLDIIKRLGKGESSVSMEVGDGNVNIKGSGGEFKLKLEEPPENDSFVIPNNILTFQFYIETFARALDRVVYALPTDIVKSCPGVVYIVDGRLFYSRDGSRLMRYEEEVFPDIVASRLAISVSNANLLVKAMNAMVERIGSIGVLDGVMLVELENFKIWIKCEDYSSCDFDRILAEGYKSDVSIDANVLISMLGHIKNVLKSEYVEVKTGSNGIKLNVGRDVEKVFNVQYLIDMLKPVSGQMVELHCFSDNGEPGGCVSVTADGGKYRAVVMG